MDQETAGAPPGEETEELQDAMTSEPDDDESGADAPEGFAKGEWTRQYLAVRGFEVSVLRGKILVVFSYKGGVGKSTLAKELAQILDAILVDLDWDEGNVSRDLGFKHETRVGAPLLDAIEKGRVPTVIKGGPHRPDFVPCHPDFVVTQPRADKMTELLIQWAEFWGRPENGGRVVVVDCHPGGSDTAAAGAMAAANLLITPVELGRQEMAAAEGSVRDLIGYRLLLVPNKVGISPPGWLIDWLERISKEMKVPVAPAISEYKWLKTRQRKMPISAQSPVPARSRRLVDELYAVAGKVLDHVIAP